MVTTTQQASLTHVLVPICLIMEIRMMIVMMIIKEDGNGDDDNGNNHPAGIPHSRSSANPAQHLSPPHPFHRHNLPHQVFHLYNYNNHHHRICHHQVPPLSDATKGGQA